MNYNLAQLNIARFKRPMEHPDNADFVASLDRVNATAESQPGFIWRFLGDSELESQTFGGADFAINMSVWSDLASLKQFVYENEVHLSVLRRRTEWFEKMEFHLVLWWVEVGLLPTLAEARQKLDVLRANGPTQDAFTFRESFDPKSA